MTTVVLTPREMEHASGIYTDWQKMNRANGARDRYGAARDLITPHAVHAQVAVAKYCNLYHYENTGDYKALDVGGLVQVRSVTNRDHCLILHPSDEDAVPFVLVLVKPPEFVLLGWLLAIDGKRKEYWRDPTGRGRHAFFVPPNQGIWHPPTPLRPMDELREHLRRQEQ